MFSYEFALFFRFFDSWYIIKYLLTETSVKQYALWTLVDQPRVHKTYCFPRSQSISVNYYIPIVKVLLFMCFIGGEPLTLDCGNQTVSLASAGEGDNALFTSE